VTDTSERAQKLQKLRLQLLECQADMNEAKRILDNVETALGWITDRRAAALAEIYGTSDVETKKVAMAVLHAIEDCYVPLIMALRGGED
jgi:hypothetical protein